MKSRTRIATQLFKFLVLALFLTLAPAALASSTWYVDGVNGNDSNDCLSSQTACQSIGHTISLASSGDTIRVAPATYYENLTIIMSLKIIGSDAATTIVDGNQAGRVFTISNPKAHVRLAQLTIRNGVESENGGGISNSGTLIINRSVVTGNVASRLPSFADGGGISNSGILTINSSTISGNTAYAGGGITSGPVSSLTINNSTISGNSADYKGGLDSGGKLTINNSTFSQNGAYYGGAIGSCNYPMTMNSSTISGNSALWGGGGIIACYNTLTLQNSIVANNSGGNCYETYNLVSSGYNLSSDDTCNFSGPGDMNNTEPMLGKLGNHGGPTETMRLLPGSPAINAGNPSGCTDDKGNLLKTDQRGWKRPDKLSGRCDIGAVEREIP